ncbi:hypothetical protein [Roseovarius sp. SYSU LYC5161]|uniref:hypothetical protein n=1 Tax=Roseovarius halophilus (ex Wu et al. 2025) TaxID=3376060 RepID=UPI003999BFD1
MSSFDKDQADKTGVDARTVRRNAERGEKVTPAALAMVGLTFMPGDPSQPDTG